MGTATVGAGTGVTSASTRSGSDRAAECRERPGRSDRRSIASDGGWTGRVGHRSVRSIAVGVLRFWAGRVHGRRHRFALDRLRFDPVHGGGGRLGRLRRNRVWLNRLWLNRLWLDRGWDGHRRWHHGGRRIDR